ncbi:MAG: UDP-glucuronic acid decarboxylase family protein [Actinomycetota bacterium]
MAKKPKRVLVTGAAGFIGSHLCDALLAKGYAVTGVDNLLTGAADNLSAACESPLFGFQEADVVEPLDYDVSVIYHLASPASPVDYLEMPVGTMLANSLGTLNCLELARSLEARMVLASTSEVYGDPEVSPQGEGYFGHVNPTGPRSCYDESKRFAEALCMAYRREHDSEVVIVRIFNTYGRRMRPDDGRVIPNFVSQALAGAPLTVYGDGGQTRSFCHVDDMVKGLLLAMETPEAAGEIINIGNPNEMRVIDLAALVKQRTGSDSPLEFEPLPQDDPRQRRPDITRAMSLLGWAPRVGIEEGLDDVIEYVRGLSP